MKMINNSFYNFKFSKNLAEMFKNKTKAGIISIFVQKTVFFFFKLKYIIGIQQQHACFNVYKKRSWKIILISSITLQTIEHSIMFL